MHPPKIPWISQRDCVAIGIFASLSFLIDISLGLILTPLVSTVPLIGGLLSAIPNAAIVFLGAYLVPRRGSVTLFTVILLTLATVTPSFGPPGFYKIAIGIILGLIAETILWVFGRRPFIYILGTGVSFALSIPATWLAWKIVHLPNSARLLHEMPILIGAYFILGITGAWIGFVFYTKQLSHVSVIEKMRHG